MLETGNRGLVARHCNAVSPHKNSKMSLAPSTLLDNSFDKLKMAILPAHDSNAFTCTFTTQCASVLVRCHGLVRLD
jgi:hypothetical protein